MSEETLAAIEEVLSWWNFGAIECNNIVSYKSVAQAMARLSDQAMLERIAMYDEREKHVHP